MAGGGVAQIHLQSFTTHVMESQNNQLCQPARSCEETFPQFDGDARHRHGAVALPCHATPANGAAGGPPSMKRTADRDTTTAGSNSNE